MKKILNLGLNTKMSSENETFTITSTPSEVDGKNLYKVSLSDNPEIYSYFLCKDLTEINLCVERTSSYGVYIHDKKSAHNFNIKYVHGPSIDEPAMVGSTHKWYIRDGKLNREGVDGSLIGVGPAIIAEDLKHWLYRGETHRVGPNGTDEGAEHAYEYTYVHSSSSPWGSGKYLVKKWYYFGKLHRIGGLPATEIWDDTGKLIGEDYAENGVVYKRT